MDDEEDFKEPATLTGQFYEFAIFLDKERNGLTINLYRLDYWLRQAHVIDDRIVTMTDTGIAFNKFSKTEVDFNDFLLIIADVCEMKNLEEETIIDALTNCGVPGEVNVTVPKYRRFFDTYVSKNKMLNIGDD